MAVKKRWHITFTSTDAVCPHSVSLSKKFGILILSLFTIFLLFLIMSAVYIYYFQSRISDAKDVLIENELLKEKLYTLSTEIDSILIKIQLMEEWEDKIRSDENFKSINKELREMGVGGIPHFDSTFVNLNEKLNLEFNMILQKQANLNNKLNFNFDSHLKLLEMVNLKEELYLSTPSIYPAYGRISDSFGWRKHPFTGKRSFHNGIDIGNIHHSPIYATANGVVRKIGKDKNLGNFILISHNFGYQTKFGHLDKIYLKKGDVVKRGQIIGSMGDTGRTTGCHLHYEVLRYNKNRNPSDYLNKLEDDIILSVN